MSLRLDLLALLAAVACLSVLVHLWTDRCPAAFPAWLNRKSRWWYGFFFCRSCLIFKLSFVAALFVRPLMLVMKAEYPAWSAVEFILNFTVIYFSAIAVGGLVFDQALKNIYYESVRYLKLVEDSQTKKGGEHA